eukprot:6921594-Prymnesium_polylepis.1
MRTHLKWLTRAHFSGKQNRLADALRVTSAWLSEYMRGTNSKSATLDGSQLNARHSTILCALTQAELPTETPTEDEHAAPATTAATAAAAAAAPAPNATSPVVAPTNTPVSAVLSVDLADVSG